MGSGNSLNSVYTGIRVFHRNRDVRDYKNFIFFAKGDRKRDEPTEFKVELSNGAMKVGKHHRFGITDSWQKFAIPLVDFS